MNKVKLMLGDNRELLKKLPDNSVDSVVTDPPYGISFMNKKWDYDLPSIDLWKEVYRVLKPGGYMLVACGTRTQHRMVCNIEDAGFEIRDVISWVYGSGFPKSLNIGKAVDKIEGEVIYEKEDAPGYRKNMEGKQPNTMSGKFTYNDVTKGTTQFEGQGTALKPAQEFFTLCRKPISEKTIAENVMKWGTGGINIDGCRISTTDKLQKLIHQDDTTSRNLYNTEKRDNGKKIELIDSGEGRFPANIIFDEEAGKMLDEQSGNSKSVKGKHRQVKNIGSFGGGLTNEYNEYNDQGGASRFFYCPKVSKKERNLGLDDTFKEQKLGHRNLATMDDKFDTKSKNNHPTIKPIKLMSYLCRLITPKNGIVLDPYMGSGSTGVAAMLEGFRFCGMEMDEDYFKIASKRIKEWEQYIKL